MMRRTTLGLLATLLIGGGAFAGEVDERLARLMASQPADAPISTIVFLKQQVNLTLLNDALKAERATIAERHQVVVSSLRQRAASTQASLHAHLTQLETTGQIERFEPYWIANAFRVDGSAAAIHELAAHPDIGRIYYNYEIELVEPVSIIEEAPGPRSVEPGVEAVRAPDVWAMGITGEGVLVANMDTGVDGNHPALEDRWAGVADPRYAGHPEWAWYDPYAGQNDFPYDNHGHGTHTMGTVCGGVPGDQIGVAPGALWIAAAPIDRGGGIPQTVADAILSFQWLADPDGDPSTFWDVPAVCSNSWRVTSSHGYPPCDETFWTFIDACEAAGVVILFSAGNEGPSAGTIGRPPDRATTAYNVCAVGAVDANAAGWPVASFSSRGPSYCTPDGSVAIKPDISAPGVNVRSSVPGGGYDVYSGTSMASPHVNGVVALMRQACPNLTVDEIKEILYVTAIDLGSAGEDNEYGWGMIDAYEAVVMAQTMCGPHPPFAFSDLYETEENTAVMITLRARDDGEPEPLTFTVTTLPEYGVLQDPNGGLIEAVPYTLAEHATDVEYTPNAYFAGEDSFRFVADDGGEPPEGGTSEEAFITITVGGPRVVYSFPLDEDPGWLTEGEWAFGQPTGQGGQSFGNPDPTSGATGPYVYGVNLNGDYSTALGGPYYCTLGPLDLSDATNTSVKFQRWLNSDYQPYVTQMIEVSHDGTNWVQVWDNGSFTISDSAWAEQEYNISATADQQAAVYIRWGHEVGNDWAWAYSGWNIDDVEVWGLVPLISLLGDMNCDGDVDFDDINAFALALTGEDAYLAVYPTCNWLNADINADGDVGFDDINPFVDVLSRR